MMNADLVLKYASDLSDIYSASTNAFAWAMTTETYRQLCWWRHLDRAYPTPPRKLRKCHERKIQRRIHREKRRWLA